MSAGKRPCGVRSIFSPPMYATRPTRPCARRAFQESDNAKPGCPKTPRGVKDAMDNDLRPSPNHSLALDLAVAKIAVTAEGLDIEITDACHPTIRDAKGRREPFRPSTNWAHAGPIIERERIELLIGSGGRWVAQMGKRACPMADSPLVAAMRAYVAAGASLSTVAGDLADR